MRKIFNFNKILGGYSFSDWALRLDKIIIQNKIKKSIGRASDITGVFIMSFDFKFVVRDKYSEEIFDIINTAQSIKADDIKTDYKAVDSNRSYSIKTGIGSIASGRSFNIGIPIYEYKNELGTWVKIEEQYTKYTSMILSSNIKRYFIRAIFEDEIYEAEYIIKSVGGYNIKYINNLGVVDISLEAFG